MVKDDIPVDIKDDIHVGEIIKENKNKKDSDKRAKEKKDNKIEEPVIIDIKDDIMVNDIKGDGDDIKVNDNIVEDDIKDIEHVDDIVEDDEIELIEKKVGKIIYYITTDNKQEVYEKLENGDVGNLIGNLITSHDKNGKKKDKIIYI